ncbi:MAG: cytochrome P450 [Microthrixaceae bacterium]|nr:cytochrome P450 [Microthrixaceae bacterium]
MYAALRDHDPVHHVDRGDYWVLTRFADVFRAARDTATYSSADGLTVAYGDLVAAGIDEARPLVMLDPPDHTGFRRLVGRGFTPRRVAEIEPAVRAFAAERIDRLVAETAGGEPADLVEALAKPLPSFVVAHYLGVPEADRGRFDRWTEAIVSANATGTVDATSDAVGELLGYFADLVERRRADPGDDTVSRLVHAADLDERTGGAEVPLLRILGFAFTMVAGGNDTATGLIAGGAELLARRPDQRRRLLDDPTLLPGAVEELLRLLSPVQGLARTVTTDVELHGRTIPAGRKVLLVYGSANRDRDEFGPDADELDVARPLGHHLAFGSGAHHCLGAAAARLEGRVVLDELLRRCPRFEVDADAGRFAPGHYVRRHESLPFLAG